MAYRIDFFPGHEKFNRGEINPFSSHLQFFIKIKRERDEEQDAVSVEGKFPRASL